MVFSLFVCIGLDGVQCRRSGFDSLILTDTSIQVLDGYITFVRPMLKPQCDFVLVTRNGSQHSKLGDVMSKLVFDAIGKCIHPTRYRQIVETQSLQLLTSKEQSILSEDQKHSSAVAKVHYQKQRSREVAVKAYECLQKLQGTKGSEVEKDVSTRLSASRSSSPSSAESTEPNIATPKKDWTVDCYFERSRFQISTWKSGRFFEETG